MNTAAPLTQPRFLDARTAWILALASGLIFALGTLPRQAWFVDDALIFQNFVRNALLGNGWVYYPGAPVEGHSSPLWVMLLTTLGLIGAKGFMAAKACSALCGILACALCALAPARNRALPVLACLMLALQPALLWWSVSGMETALMTLLVTASALAMMRGSDRWAALAAGLATITRPEGAIYLLPVAAWIGLGCANRRQTARSLALAFAPAAGWQIYRLLAYGTLISNSALAKIGMGAGVTWDTGLDYLRDAIQCSPAPWLMFLCALPAFALTFNTLSRPQRLTSAAMLGMIMLSIAFAARFGDWMPQGRMLIPILPLLVLWALHQACGCDVRWNRLIVAGLAMGILATAARQSIDYRPYVRQDQTFAAQWPAARMPFTGEVKANAWSHFCAKMLLRYTVPGDHVFVADVGQTGYLASDVEIIDEYGLISRYESEYLARRHGDDDYRAHFHETLPSVAFVELMDDHGYAKLRLPSLVNGELDAQYTPVSRMPMPDNHLLLVLVRNDALQRHADPQRLRRWREAAPGLSFADAYLLSEDLNDSGIAE